MRSDVFAADFKEMPYWWEAAPPDEGGPPSPLPERVDVAIVGSGITGVVAARDLARGGRSVAVFDAGGIGSGAARRNAGFVGRTSKHRFTEIIKDRGLPHALRVYRELVEGFEGVLETIETEGLACGFTRRGRFIPAFTVDELQALEREHAALNHHLGLPYEVVAPGEQGSQLGTDAYHGGIVIPDLAGVHPGLYHAGLLERARAAGAAFFPHSPVLGITGDAGDHVLQLPAGQVRARAVIVCTNGYTERSQPWLRRRLVPFDAFMIATEPLSPEVMARALPAGRTCIDSRRDPLYVRPSPDGTRVLFGGLTGSGPGNTLDKAQRLVERLHAMLPDLAAARISHAWTGRCAATLDMYPHMAEVQGIHYVGGYCFVGIPTGTLLGRKVARRILGQPGGDSVYAESPFPGHPLYTGSPWFVPGLMRYYGWLDRRDAARAA